MLHSFNVKPFPLLPCLRLLQRGPSTGGHRGTILLHGAVQQGACVCGLPLYSATPDPTRPLAQGVRQLLPAVPPQVPRGDGTEALRQLLLQLVAHAGEGAQGERGCAGRRGRGGAQSR